MGSSLLQSQLSTMAIMISWIRVSLCIKKRDIRAIYLHKVSNKLKQRGAKLQGKSGVSKCPRNQSYQTIVMWGEKNQ